MICSTRSSVILLSLLLLSTISFAQDSSGVRTVGRLPFLNECYGAVASEHYVYMIGAGLHAVDVADPSSPQVVGYCNVSGYCIAISAEYIYVPTYYGLKVINISNPLSPQIVGSCASQSAYGIAISGNYAYLVGDSLQVIDISNPQSPQYVRSVPVGNAWCIATSGNLLFIGSDNVRILDISNPSSPIIVGYCPNSGGAYSMAAQGNYLYYTNGWFHIIDATDPAHPQLVDDTNHFTANCVTVSGSHAYVTGSALRIVDMSNPASLQIVGTCPFNSSWQTMAVAIAGDYVYAATQTNGIYVFNVATPSSPQVTGSYTVSGSVKNVALSGDYAFFESDSANVKVADISNPTSPQYVGICTEENMYSGYNNVGLVVAGNYLYDANGGSFRILDVTNPLSSPEIGSCEISSDISDFVVSGNYAFLLGSELTSVDISNPTQPTVVSSIGLPPSGANRIAVSGSYAFLVGDSLTVVTLSNPASPHIIAIGGAWGNTIAISDNYAIIGGAPGLQIFDITIPVVPQWVATLALTDSITGITATGNYVYITCGNSGLRVINFANPSLPHEVGYYNTQGYAMRLARRDSLIVVADVDNLGIYDCSQALVVVDRASDAVPQTFSLKQNYPNPFNPTTTIEYTIPKMSKVELKLFDVTGREVGTLVNFNQNPGTYRVKLDASKLASGIYFYRLNAGTFSTTKKMSVVK